MDADIVPRYSGERVQDTEYLNDHIWKMTAMALLLHDKIQFDLKELIYRIQVHDLEECVTQDVVRKVKHHDKDIKDRIDSIAYEELSKYVSNDILQDAQTAKDHSTIEGCLVHFLDVYQAYQYLASEVLMKHNEYLAETLQKDCIPYLLETYDTISELFPELKKLGEYLPIQ